MHHETLQKLKVSLVQSELFWCNPVANRKSFEDKLSSLTGSTDIIVLPEMFTTGFTMEAASNAEEMNGPTMKWMAEQADRSEAIIVGSLIIREGQDYFNRLIWMFPGGMFQVYDKRHLFAMAGENEHYTAGTKRLTVEYKGWRICPLICYDLRFPVWSRNDDQIDLIIYTANWPSKRSYDWNTLLKARAIENQCYVVAVNRIGTDPNGHDYNGDSCVIDPAWHKTIWHSEKEEAIQTITLDKEHISEVRSSLPFLADKDEFVILT